MFSMSAYSLQSLIAQVYDPYTSQDAGVFTSSSLPTRGFASCDESSEVILSFSLGCTLIRLCILQRVLNLLVVDVFSVSTIMISVCKQVCRVRRN